MSTASPKIYFLTILTMMAFAANSVLARMALLGEGTDPIAFTAVRLISGALFLSLILMFRRKKVASENSPGFWNALALFVYALAFSLSYVSLGAGMGALLLFASVQISLVGIGLYKGQVFSRMEWLGLLGALLGLVYLFLPGLKAPPLIGALLMVLAGVAWGAYTYLGKTANSAIGMITRSFQLAAIPCALFIIFWPFFGIPLNSSPVLLILGIVSGALTSGLGYVVWYSVVGHLSISLISTVQLSVPLIAMLGGLLFIGEELNNRLVIASILILGGIFLTARGYSKTSEKN